MPFDGTANPVALNRARLIDALRNIRRDDWDFTNAARCAFCEMAQIFGGEGDYETIGLSHEDGIAIFGVYGLHLWRTTGATEIYNKRKRLKDVTPNDVADALENAAFVELNNARISYLTRMVDGAHTIGVAPSLAVSGRISYYACRRVANPGEPVMPFDNGNFIDDDTLALIAARELLVRDGWCIGELQDAQGRHCALGAIGFSLHNSNLVAILVRNGRLCRRLAQLIELEHPQFKRESSDNWTITYFNDTQTSVEPILALFDKTIAQGLGVKMEDALEYALPLSGQNWSEHSRAR